MPMIKYPIKKTVTGNKLPTTANRGMDLEASINETNQAYLDRDIAIIYKKPGPVQVV